MFISGEKQSTLEVGFFMEWLSGLTLPRITVQLFMRYV